MKNNKPLVLVIAALVGIGIAGNSYAAKEGFNVGVKMGVAYNDGLLKSVAEEVADEIGNDAYQTNPFAAGISAGYNFSLGKQWLLGPAFEYQYLGGGSLSGAGVSVPERMTSWGASAVLTYKVLPTLDVYAKAGVVQTSTQIDFSAVQTGEIANINNTQNMTASVGVGVGYNITENWEVFAEYNHIFGSEPNFSGEADLFNGLSSPLSSNSAWLGVRYNV